MTAGTGTRRRRTGCLVFAALWLCVAAVSATAGLLAVRGDIVLARGELRQTRLWLVQEEGNRGLGLSSARFTSGGEGSGEACVETRVRFFLWQTSQPAQNARYCECYRRVEGRWEYTGTCTD
jgi:hypothetical protein